MDNDKIIRIDADLGLKAVEKVDIFVYEGEQLIDVHFDMLYGDIKKIGDECKIRFKDAKIEIYGLGQDCAGRSLRWRIEN